MKSIRDKSSKCQRAGTASDARFPGSVSCQLPLALCAVEFLFRMVLAGEHTTVNLRRLRNRYVRRLLSCRKHEVDYLAIQENLIKHKFKYRKIKSPLKLVKTLLIMFDIRVQIFIDF